MTIVSNDPSWRSTIDFYRSYSYFVAAACSAVVYDWMLAFGQEVRRCIIGTVGSLGRNWKVNLVWRQRWTFMTLLYIGVRYIGILYSAIMIMEAFPTISLSDIGCTIVLQIQTWASVIANTMLCVIMITRLHAIYDRSRKMLIFLLVIFLALSIASWVFVAVISSRVSVVEFVLSGTHQCVSSGYNPLLVSASWMLGTAWEILALCLAAWITVKHFRELQRTPRRWNIGNCLMVLIKSHVFYFVGFAAVAGFCLGGGLSPNDWDSPIFNGVLQIAAFVQMFVLGPRLILSVRERHAEFLEDSDVGSGMTAIAFQGLTPTSTASGLDV